MVDHSCEPLVTDPGWCWAVRFADGCAQVNTPGHVCTGGCTHAGTVLVQRSPLTRHTPDVLAPVEAAIRSRGLVLVMSSREPDPDFFGGVAVWEWWGPAQ